MHVDATGVTGAGLNTGAGLSTGLKADTELNAVLTQRLHEQRQLLDMYDAALPEQAPPAAHCVHSDLASAQPV
jgi:hypothetical protein